MGNSFKSLPNAVNPDRQHREAVAQMGNNADARAALGGGRRRAGSRRCPIFRWCGFLRSGFGRSKAVGRRACWSKGGGDRVGRGELARSGQSRLRHREPSNRATVRITTELLSQPQGEYALSEGCQLHRKSSTQKEWLGRRGFCRSGRRGRADRQSRDLRIPNIRAQHRGVLPRGSIMGYMLPRAVIVLIAWGTHLPDHEFLDQRSIRWCFTSAGGVWAFVGPDLFRLSAQAAGAKEDEGFARAIARARAAAQQTQQSSSSRLRRALPGQASRPARSGTAPARFQPRMRSP